MWTPRHLSMLPITHPSVYKLKTQPGIKSDMVVTTEMSVCYYTHHDLTTSISLAHRHVLLLGKYCLVPWQHW